MKRAGYCYAVTLLLTGLVHGGSNTLDGKDMQSAPPTITETDHWYFNLGVPGWLAGVSGDIGLHGATSHVDVDFDQILRNIRGIATISLEARKGRLGVYADFLYLGLSASGTNDGLISKVQLDLDQYLADGEVYYRILDDPRGRLDLRAGARYLNIYNRLQLFGNNAQIDQAATNLTNALAAEVRGLLERKLRHALDDRDPTLPIAPLAFGEKAELRRRILAAKQNPNPAVVQQKIATILRNGLNRTFSLTEDWTDPYIGAGGRYNLSKAFYLTGKVDVGGFGAGSDVSVQASAALGCQLTRSIYSELGYRYLYENYDRDNFLYKVSTQGIQITTGVIF
jgi:opacity protein-like surface antigen